MKLKNKVAIVTGGGRDIGKETSIRLAKEGAKVVVNYCNGKEAAEDTVQKIVAAGGEAILVQGDMTRSADVANLVAAATAAYGNEIHILVNVAGGMVARKTTAEIDEEFWDHVINLNLKSVFLACKAVTPLMPQGAAIINFSSQAGRDGGGPGASAYATSKGAVATYTRSLAKEFGPKGIRVNSVAPGMIATTFHDTFTKPEVRSNVANGTPLRREGNAAEVAGLVAYLASDDAGFITGDNIDINGGTFFS